MSIYGFQTISSDSLEHPLEGLAESPSEWRAIFQESVSSVSRYLVAHDPIEVLSKASSQQLINSYARKEQIAAGDIVNSTKQMLFEQVEVEILQALVLMQLSRPKLVPAAPSGMERLFSLLTRLPVAFSRMQPDRYADAPERKAVVHRARLHTIYGRNSFLKSDCETIVRRILQPFDDLSERKTGFRFSEMFLALTATTRTIEQRLNEFFDHCREAALATSSDDVLSQIRFYCDISPTARRAWALGKRHCRTIEQLQFVAFQLSEICNSWIYTLELAALERDHGERAAAFIKKIAIQPGDLASANPEHFVMNNPIWSRPFIALENERVVFPLPTLIYGFPFQIFEQFITQGSQLDHAYADARAAVLETMLHDCISSAMPSGKAYQNVMWRDETTGAVYENDVVAVVGNTIFLLEAKSGRLSDAARRGGELSLLRNFRELFVEPGEQATRLETYINTKGTDALLWQKTTGARINLELETPKVVHKLSVCIEHFGSLSSAKHNLKALGAIADDSAWAPVLSVGELMLVWRYLDTEVSFFHYLTRRATLEQLVDFVGDEQDILSTYLINGLCITPDQVGDQQLHFLEADQLVRSEKTPRSNRRDFQVYVPMSGYWKRVLEEIYRDATMRHRFDIVQVILNQDPHSLAGVEGVAKRWWRGGQNRQDGRKVQDGDIIYSRFKIGNRVFVLACYLLAHPIGEYEWTERSRSIARGGAHLFEASDCAVLLRVRGSKEWTFDALSFHRFMATGA